MTMTKGEAINFLEKCRWFIPYTSEADAWDEALDMAIEALRFDRPHRMNYEFPRCNICKYCWTNTNSDESYCEKADGERITLHRGQGKPSWCPRIKGGGAE